MISETLRPNGAPAPEKNEASALAPGLERKKTEQKNRIRMLNISTWNYVVGTTGFALYALIGSVSWMVPAMFLTVTMSASMVFLLIFRMEWNLRLAEPNFFAPQMLFAGLLLLSFLYFVPHLGFLILSSLFVTMQFGLVHFSTRQFIVTWLLISSGTALIFLCKGPELQLPASNGREIAMLWISHMLVLARFSIIGTHLKMLRKKLRTKNALLQESLEHIQKLANHDELTGAFNRRRLMELIEQEYARAARGMEEFHVMMLDIDHFKKVNDTYGHQTGDRVLQEFCACIRSQLRVTDLFGRYGGEEFMVLFPVSSNSCPVDVVTERIRIAVAGYNWSIIAPGLHVTLSAGVTAYRTGENVEALLSRVDQALYDAKHSGRNCISIV